MAADLGSRFRNSNFGGSKRTSISMSSPALNSNGWPASSDLQRDFHDEVRGGVVARRQNALARFSSRHSITDIVNVMGQDQGHLDPIWCSGDITTWWLDGSGPTQRTTELCDVVTASPSAYTTEYSRHMLLLLRKLRGMIVADVDEAYLGVSAPSMLLVCPVDVFGRRASDKVSTYEINFRKKSLAMPAYTPTGAFSDMRPCSHTGTPARCRACSSLRYLPSPPPSCQDVARPTDVTMGRSMQHEQRGRGDKGVYGAASGRKGGGNGRSPKITHPPTSSMVGHDSHMRRSGIEPGSPWVGGALAIRSATAAPPKSGVNGRSPRKPGDQLHRSARFPHATPPGIEPGSPRLKASSLTPMPPRPRRFSKTSRIPDILDLQAFRVEYDTHRQRCVESSFTEFHMTTLAHEVSEYLTRRLGTEQHIDCLNWRENQAQTDLHCTTSEGNKHKSACLDRSKYQNWRENQAQTDLHCSTSEGNKHKSACLDRSKYQNWRENQAQTDLHCTTSEGNKHKSACLNRSKYQNWRENQAQTDLHCSTSEGNKHKSKYQNWRENQAQTDLHCSTSEGNKHKSACLDRSKYQKGANHLTFKRRLKGQGSARMSGNNGYSLGKPSVTLLKSQPWRGHGGWAVRLLASHQVEPGSVSGPLTPDFCKWESCRDDAAGRRVFSGISRFPHPFISALLHTHLTLPSSALKTSLLRAAQISPLSVVFKYLTPDSTNFDLGPEARPLLEAARGWRPIKLRPPLLHNPFRLLSASQDNTPHSTRTTPGGKMRATSGKAPRWNSALH
ncbi:hypothetical protein PR048_031523 [Dryococelus australis]|uniref:Uncharacterized protein n=1 Tax=Dryococelus australis TaxID=614101 RepID=A0ABQ9G5J2_9NEOP|nr:hypothetical protein PR048_031523 [Dryococelus australis]